MITVSALLYILAFICFMLATFNISTPVNLVGLGLAFWVLVSVIGTAGLKP